MRVGQVVWIESAEYRELLDEVLVVSCLQGPLKRIQHLGEDVPMAKQTDPSCQYPSHWRTMTMQNLLKIAGVALLAEKSEPILELG
jgi:hypothetical protein